MLFMKILGIETSCDETAAAVVANGKSVLSNSVLSSLDIHKEFGGVIPEIAQRFHMRFIDKVTCEALKKAKMKTADIDAIAVTYGPGLVGALLVGLAFAKSLSYSLKKPLVGVNHLQAHLYSVLMSEQKIKFPCIGLVVSGGHTNLVLVKDILKYEALGQTHDDAVGEAFDKVAKILGLGYPGGPIINKLSWEKRKEKIDFPRAYLAKDSLDFSFSGLKTAVLYYRKKINKKKLSRQQQIDIAGAFEDAVIEVLVKKAIIAAQKYKVNDIIVGGGVSQNTSLRKELIKSAAEKNLKAYFPERSFCQDNAAMIAGLAYHKFVKNKFSDLSLAAETSLALDIN
jgi:N6-L-threonylcarbamoyladenine synthase